jgi:hypothetical protein
MQTAFLCRADGRLVLFIPLMLDIGLPNFIGIKRHRNLRYLSVGSIVQLAHDDDAAHPLHGNQYYIVSVSKFESCCSGIVVAYKPTKFRSSSVLLDEPEENQRIDSGDDSEYVRNDESWVSEELHDARVSWNFNSSRGLGVCPGRA